MYLSIRIHILKKNYKTGKIKNKIMKNYVRISKILEDGRCDYHNIKGVFNTQHIKIVDLKTKHFKNNKIDTNIGINQFNYEIKIINSVYFLYMDRLSTNKGFKTLKDLKNFLLMNLTNSEYF